MEHYHAMMPILKYSVDTASRRGLVLKPYREWDGSKNHEFIISGMSDSGYAKESRDRCSVLGHVVFLRTEQLRKLGNVLFLPSPF